MENSLMHLQTEPFTTEREWTVDNIPVLNATVSLPQPVSTNSRVARRIHRYYHLQARAFLRYCECWLFPQAKIAYQAALDRSVPLPNFQANLSYHITYNENGFWSLYTQSKEISDSDTPSLLTRRSDTWDLKSGYPVPVSSFFASHSPWKKRLLTLISDEIQRCERSGDSLYHETWRKDLRRHYNSQNFYLSPDGLIFFYPMHTIASAGEGIPTFLLPFQTLGIHFPFQ